ARGVRGITLGDGARVVTMLVAAEGDILTATERGYGKRTPLEDYPRKGRGTQGVIAIQTSERNGELVGATQIADEQELMLISNQGTLVRTRASEVARVGRNTQGVTLIRLPAEEKLVGLAPVAALSESDELAALSAGDSNGEFADRVPPGADADADARPGDDIDAGG